MKEAVLTAPGSIEFRRVDPPDPRRLGPGEVLLEIRRIGVCGSDVHVWHGDHPFTPYPVIQGHEFSATVVAVGAGVAGIAPGAKATALPQLVCGTCAPCRRGDEHICENLRVQGFQAPGVARDLFVAAARRVVVLPPAFSFEDGAFVEPCAVAVHATERAGDLAGRNVVVAGAGPIGNLVAQAAAARGANVLIADLSEHRLAVARDCGIPHTTNARAEELAAAVARAFGREGFAVAIECAGSEAALGALIPRIGKGGRIVVVGVFGRPPRVDVARVCEHELTLAGSLMYQRPHYETAVAWIAGGRFRVGPLCSRHFPFDRYAEAYRFIDAEGDRCLKVFIDVNP